MPLILDREDLRIEQNIPPENPKVTPHIRISDIHRLQERIRVPIRAQLTAARRTIPQIPTRLKKVLLQVLAASLPRGSIEAKVFVRCAGDLLVCHARAEHALDEVSERTYAVHEDPEAREGLRAREHTAEDYGEHESEKLLVSAWQE